jgi:multidrug efflux pump subunit AcrB
MKNEIKTKGAFAWMAKNHVAANLLMIAFLLGGFMFTTQIKQEVFPDLQMDYIVVTLPYPGASPEEVEKGVVMAVEESIQGLDGIKRVSSTSREGVGSVFVELILGTDPNKALSDVKNAVDRIRTFPQEMERYTVKQIENRRNVISLVIHGDQTMSTLKQIAENVRADLIKDEEVTLVELTGVRKPEIAIEVPQENLREYNLTLSQIAARIRSDALELPGGRVKTDGGEVLVRTTERRYWGDEYAEMPIVTRNDGTIVRLKDIANIKDSFEEDDTSSLFNGKPAVMVNVYRVGDETPSKVSAAVKTYLEELNAKLPDSVQANIWIDQSEVLEDRINLLVRNAFLGLVLVLLLLGLFLDIRLAFWVTLGIPISVLGSMLFIPAFGVSINMISLFAIIVTIGIVVDDAVIVGENIYHMRRKGVTYLEAAIQGVKDMAVPVTFSILTNIAAFLPLMFVPGITGKIFKVIPIVVVIIFLVSLVEALFILPAHLSHKSKKGDSGIIGFLNKRREWFGKALIKNRDSFFKPILEFMIRWRYATIAWSLVSLLVVAGMVGSGRIEFTFMPKIESERVSASVMLPFGSPVEDTAKLQQILLDTANEVIEENGGQDIIRGVYSQLGYPMSASFSIVSIGSGVSGGHQASVAVYMVPINERDISAVEFVRQWNKKIGRLSGIENLSFSYSTGPGSGQPLNFLLSHPNIKTLEVAAVDLAKSLENYEGVRDINDGFSGGKSQLDFKIKPAAQSLGITARDLALQVRSAFYGAEALRNQRGRDEVKVMVRLPLEERKSRYNIEELIIRAPNGAEIPLREAADVVTGRSYTEILRSDGKRNLNVTGDIDRILTNADKVVADVTANEIPRLMEKYPGLAFEVDGEQRDKAEAMSALGFGFVVALFAIYTLLAIPFKSYSQPVIIMMSIPFGMIGAVLGHIIMGYELSLMSMFGVIALAGVVVNDSLILVDTANKNRWQGMGHFESIRDASLRRFRPIILTSLTTFIGLAPMIFETSLQARFLVPMALSLGFGILFATMIALVLIPCLYMVLVDIKRIFKMESKADAEARLYEKKEKVEVATAESTE